MIEGAPENIIWCYGIYQPAFDEMQRNIPDIQFVEGVSKDGMLLKKQKVLTEGRNAKGQVVSYGCWRQKKCTEGVTGSYNRRPIPLEVRVDYDANARS